MKNRMFIAIAAMLMALAFILPAQAAGPQAIDKSGGAHAHGPHTNPQGKTVGNGDPYWSTSWWAHYPADSSSPSGYDVIDWGGTGTDNGWSPGSLQQTGTLTLRDQNTGNPAWQQTQTVYDNATLNMYSPKYAIQPGHTYLLEWHAVATLLLPGWTWGAFNTAACVPSGNVVTCDYTTNQILIAGFATPTVQATNTPAPTATPQVTATPSPLNCQASVDAWANAPNELAYMLVVSISGSSGTSISQVDGVMYASDIDTFMSDYSGSGGNGIQTIIIGTEFIEVDHIGNWTIDSIPFMHMMDGRTCQPYAGPVVVTSF